MIGLLVVVSGVLYLGVGLLPATFVALTIPIVLAHSASGANWVLATVLLQELVPDRVRGRVFAAELMVLMAVEALVVLAAASLLEASVLDLPSAILAFAGLQCVTGLAYTRWLKRAT